MENKNYSISIPGIPPIPPIPPGIPPIPPGIPPPGGPPLDLLDAITSSIRKSMQAASVADFIICSLITTGSNTFCLYISKTFVLLTLIPVHFIPLFCFALNSAIVSIGSIPALVARDIGIVSNASANLITANCSLPSKPLDQFLM